MSAQTQREGDGGDGIKAGGICYLNNPGNTWYAQNKTRPIVAKTAAQNNAFKASQIQPDGGAFKGSLHWGRLSASSEILALHSGQ
jgi:hypothetical protein